MAPFTTPVRIGDWFVNPNACEISRDGKRVRLDFRAMQLLGCLASRAGEVVSIDDLLNQVWPEVAVSQDSVYQAVTSLRRQLGDDPKNPTYIETVPRLGYRMVAQVAPWSQTSAATSANEKVELKNFLHLRSRTRLLFVVSVSLMVVLAGLLFRGKIVRSYPSATPVAQAVKSIAVLPFLDLTEGMHEEEFADGMTEELIDRLSKVPGLQVPAPTSSFFYKGKQIAVSDIAKALGVTYVLDGSVRKSGDRLRVAARLVRADNGYVIWTESYDRSFHDVLMVQDDIASEVTKALTVSIGTGPEKGN